MIYTYMDHELLWIVVDYIVNYCGLLYIIMDYYGLLWDLYSLKSKRHHK